MELLVKAKGAKSHGFQGSHNPFNDFDIIQFAFLRMWNGIFPLVCLALKVSGDFRANLVNEFSTKCVSSHLEGITMG